MGHITISGIDFDFIGYTFCILYLIWRINDLLISRTLNIALFSLLFFSLTAKFYLNLPFAPLWKQYIPMVIIYLSYYDFFKYYNNSKKLFFVYVRIAYITAVFGLIQLAVKALFGIKLLTHYNSLFVDSVAYEPSHYSCLILPACVYAIMRFRSNIFRSAIILLAAIGTFTATTYVSLMVVVVLIYFNPLYLLVLVPLLYYFYSNIFLDIDKFQSRIDGFYVYFEKGALTQVRSSTSLSFLSNFEVAKYSIQKSPLIGSGLGGNEMMYERYFSGTAFKYHYLYGVNALSAHNLLIRIFSEMGLVGGVLYIFLLVRGLILRAPFVYKMIAIASFSHFLCKALKLGGYFDYATPFFVMLMWFNFRDYKRYLKYRSNKE